MVCPELANFVQFFIAAGNYSDRGAHGFGKLNRKNRNATRALNQYMLARN
jgi:hypothetical protein